MTPDVAPTLVILGVTGDLAKRKLLPALSALSALCAREALPFGHIIGTSRRPLVLDAVLVAGDPLRSVFETAPLPDEPDAYRALAERLARIGGEVFFYLAVPPGSAGPLAARLAANGCQGTLVLEKPFGMDEASAREEAARIAHAFGDKVVRVDHYLCKPLIERLIAAAPARGASVVTIVAAEALGLEGRADFYDQTGALRDVGNHLLSLLCAALGARDSAERLRELAQLTVVRARRGQYEGYAGEVGRATHTETLVSLELSHRGYPGLAIMLASGKALGKKETAVRASAGQFSIEFTEEPADQDAHERLFAALVRKERAPFLTEEEAIESMRLLDAARRSWGSLTQYAKGDGAAVGVA